MQGYVCIKDISIKSSDVGEYFKHAIGEWHEVGKQDNWMWKINSYMFTLGAFGFCFIGLLS